jgi:hypothetical protein
VLFELVQPIEPRSLNKLVASVATTAMRRGARRLTPPTSGLQPISQKLGEELVRQIAATPANIPVLQRILSEVSRPKHFENGRALQEDAVTLALKVFGSVDGAARIALPGADTAIGTVRLQEDAVIEHDARWIPGWRLASSDLTGKAVFVRGGEQLEVFTANKRPLEELFGVDLIYLSKARGALVMVQYKMMEPERRDEARQIETEASYVAQAEEREWTVPVDAQFRGELKRMAQFDKDTAPDGPYRLKPGAFYFKLVRRHAAINSAGIILSLGHLNRLLREGGASGPRGGLRISYQTLNGHYLRSDPFVELVRSGYIGTRGTTTDHLEVLMNATLTGGRAIVAAIQSATTRRTPTRAARSA